LIVDRANAQQKMEKSEYMDIYVYMGGSVLSLEMRVGRQRIC